MKLKILILLALVFLISSFYAAWRTFHNRYPAELKKTPASPQQNFNQESPANEGEKREEGENNPEAITKKSPGDILGISETDCENRCSRFGTPDELRYCENICGLAPPDTSGNCDNLAGIEKDYCLKDLGIGKKDFKICDQISDEALKKTCRNRVTEDFMDESGGPIEPE